jgi:hypothetical protein
MFETSGQPGAIERFAQQTPGPRGVLCIGLLSSGSTWAYNVVREVFAGQENQAPHAAFFCDEITAEHERTLTSAPKFILKSHHPAASLRALFELSGLPVILTVRDPRDAAASLMQRFGYGFEEALQQIASSATAILPLLDRPNVLLLRYETGFAAEPGTVDLIAARLGPALLPAVRDRIFELLSPDSVHRTIEALDARGVFTKDAPPASTWDPATQWHPAHLGDGRVGKWADVLTGSQAARLIQATRPFCAALGYDLGYDLGAPIGAGTELEFSTHGLGPAYLETGFSPAESWGAWTDQPAAMLRLPLAQAIGSRMRLTLRCVMPLVMRTDRPDCCIRILVNGREVTKISAAADNPGELLLVYAFEGQTVSDAAMLVIEFEATGLRSPADCEQSTDQRLLGIGIVRLRLDDDAAA